MRVLVGSKSGIKLEGVGLAADLFEPLGKHDHDTVLDSIDVQDSEQWKAAGIPRQPFGFKETFRGAVTRAEVAMDLSIYKSPKRGKAYDVYVGVENGLMFFGDGPDLIHPLDSVTDLRGDSLSPRMGFFDVPIVVACRALPGRELSWGVGIGGGHSVPSWAASAALKSELGEVYGTKDPAAHLTKGKARRKHAIMFAAAAAMSEALGEFSGPEETTFRANFGRKLKEGMTKFVPSWGDKAYELSLTQAGREELYKTFNQIELEITSGRSVKLDFGDSRGPPLSERPRINVADFVEGLPQTLDDLKKGST